MKAADFKNFTLKMSYFGGLLTKIRYGITEIELRNQKHISGIESIVYLCTNVTFLGAGDGDGGNSSSLMCYAV